MFVLRASALLAIGSSLISQAAAQKQCDLKFTRFSRGNTASFLGTVEHHITLQSNEDGKPGVPEDTSTCWEVIGKRAGCTWSKEGNSTLAHDWTIEHEGYTIWSVHDKDIEIFGNGCDGTTLKCTGGKGHYTIPALDPNSPGQVWYFTTTDCQPDGEFTLDPSTAGGPYVPEGAQVVQDTSFQPPAATCENQADPQECVDNYFSCSDDTTTAYFAADASLPASLTEWPTAEPIDQPKPGC